MNMCFRNFALAALLCCSSACIAATDSAVDATYAAMSDISRSKIDVSAKVSELNRIYDQTLNERLKNVRRLDDISLHALYGALDMLATYTMFAGYERNIHYVDQMEVAFSELRRRSIATDKNYTDLLDAYIAARDFKRAGALSTSSPAIASRALPAIEVQQMFDPAAPAEYVVDADTRALKLKQVNLDLPYRLVIVSGCNFARSAASMIDADPVLRDAFTRAHAIWLAPADRNFDLDEIAQWNREFPRQQITMAYKNSAWKDMDFSRIPTFYFFQEGKLVAEHRGWSKKNGPSAIHEILSRIGVLRP